MEIKFLVSRKRVVAVADASLDNSHRTTVRARGVVARCFAVLGSILTGAVLASSAAVAQEVPGIISPLQVEPDTNGVNIVSGQIPLQQPVLSVPAAPRLRFASVADAAPYFSGSSLKGRQGEVTLASGNYSIHTAFGPSDTFRCTDGTDCDTLIGTGSTFSPISKLYRQRETGAVFTFNLKNMHRTVNTSGSYRIDVQYYASKIEYPDGEVITFTYNTYTTGVGANAITQYRPARISSSVGYYIDIAYATSAITPEWFNFSSAALYSTANPSQALASLTASGSSVADIAGRVFQCTGCPRHTAANIEVSEGQTVLPSEASPNLTVTRRPDYPLVASVVRDGRSFSYQYTNIRYNSSYSVLLFDQVAVTGPGGYQQTYNIRTLAPLGAPGSVRNAISSVVDPLGRQTLVEHDQLFRPYKLTEPEGNSTEVTYDRYGNILTKTSRAKPGSGLPDLVEQSAIEPNCAGVLCYRPIYFRDAKGNQTDYSWGTHGGLLTQLDPADANGQRRKLKLTYDSLNRPIREEVCAADGAGTELTCGTATASLKLTTYWGDTRLPATQTQADGTGANPLTTTYAYDSAGRVLSRDPPRAGADDATYYRYDILGRKTWEIGPKDANGFRQATRTTYRDADDQVTKVESGHLTSETDTNLVLNQQVETAYNAQRQPVVSSVSPPSASPQTLTQTSYDALGRTECVAVRMNAAAFGSLPASACSLGTEGSQGPDRITKSVYDVAGQLIQLRKAVGTSLEQAHVTYTYTPNRKQEYVTDANGNRARFLYDGYDRLFQWNFPDKNSPGVTSASDYEAYQYDANGNRIYLRKRDGRVINYGYDALNRVTSKTYPNGGARAVYYAYDIRGLQTEARFDSPSGGDAILSAWDAFGRQTQSINNMGAAWRWLDYQYDESGNRTRIMWHDGQHVDSSWDALGRLFYSGINGLSVGLIHTPYDSAGRLSGVYRYNISVSNWAFPTIFGYDGVSRLASYSHWFPNSAVNVATSFGYNPASQIVSRTRDNDDYRFTGNVSIDRAYATNGLNQYSTAGSASFTYDANGNLTSDGTTSYTYDIENRLTGTSTGVVLTYDPLGRLWQTYSPATGATQFLYDGDALVAEYDGAGTMLKRYVHGPAAGQDDPLVEYVGSSTASPRYLFADHQGSIVAIADQNGNRIAVNGYDEYGIPNGYAGSGMPNTGRFQYTGQAWIPELGMYHYKARVYSPTLGRFLQTDPIGYEDQVNLYAYAGNDPINDVDPTGESRTRARLPGQSRSISALYYNARAIAALARLRRADPSYREPPQLRAPGGLRTQSEGDVYIASLQARRMSGTLGQNVVGQTINAIQFSSVISQSNYTRTTNNSGGQTRQYSNNTSSSLSAFNQITGGNYSTLPNGTLLARNVDMGGGVTGTFNLHQGGALGRTGMVLEGTFSAQVTGSRIPEVHRVKIEFSR